MSSIQWRYPRNVIDDSSGGIYQWYDKDNIKSDDGNEAYVYRSAGGEFIHDIVRLVIYGSVTGDNKASFSGNDGIPSSSMIRVFGGIRDYWGTSLTPVIVNRSDFGLLYRANEDGAGSGYSHYLRCSDFNFDIPSSANILGIIVHMKHRQDFSSGVNMYIDFIRIGVIYDLPGNYGIKVSLPGYSVLSAQDINLPLKSDAFLLKVKSSGVINMTSSGVWYYVNHGMGYIPHFLAYYKDGSGHVFLCTGNSNKAIARINQTNLAIKNVSGINTTAYYYIFYEAV